MVDVLKQGEFTSVPTTAGNTIREISDSTNIAKCGDKYFWGEYTADRLTVMSCKIGEFTTNEVEVYSDYTGSWTGSYMYSARSWGDDIIVVGYGKTGSETYSCIACVSTDRGATWSTETCTAGITGTSVYAYGANIFWCDSPARYFYADMFSYNDTPWVYYVSLNEVGGSNDQSFLEVDGDDMYFHGYTNLDDDFYYFLVYKDSAFKVYKYDGVDEPTEPTYVETLTGISVPTSWNMNTQFYWKYGSYEHIVMNNRIYFRKGTGSWQQKSRGDASAITGVVWEKDSLDQYAIKFLLWDDDIYRLFNNGILSKYQTLENATATYFGHTDWYATGSGNEIYQNIPVAMSVINCEVENSYNESPSGRITTKEDIYDSQYIELYDRNDFLRIQGWFKDIDETGSLRKAKIFSPIDFDLRERVNNTYSVATKVSDIMKDAIDDLGGVINYDDNTIPDTTDTYTPDFKNRNVKSVFDWGQKTEKYLLYITPDFKAHFNDGTTQRGWLSYDGQYNYGYHEWGLSGLTGATQTGIYQATIPGENYDFKVNGINYSVFYDLLDGPVTYTVLMADMNAVIPSDYLIALVGGDLRIRGTNDGYGTWFEEGIGAGDDENMFDHITGFTAFETPVLPENFTIGSKITGGTSLATGIISKMTDDGTSGDLYLTDVVGTFQDDETITDEFAGTGIVNGTLTPISIVHGSQNIIGIKTKTQEIKISFALIYGSFDRATGDRLEATAVDIDYIGGGTLTSSHPTIGDQTELQAVADSRISAEKSNIKKVYFGTKEDVFIQYGESINFGWDQYPFSVTEGSHFVMGTVYSFVSGITEPILYDVLHFPEAKTTDGKKDNGINPVNNQQLIEQNAKEIYDLSVSGVSFGSPTGNIDIGDSAVEGVLSTATRADHQHTFTAPGAGYPVDVAATEADGSATTPARSDHKHAHGTGYSEDAHHSKNHDNTEHTTNYHTESDGTGVVTVHSDVTSAGSGDIITSGERTALHAESHALDTHDNPTGSVPMNTQKLTGLAAGTTSGDSVRYEQLHAESHALDSHSNPTGPVAMNTQKLTGLAAGTTSGDSVRYEQLAGGDTDAIHDNVANEITAITPKTTLADADELVLEDSAAAFVKKAVTFANLKTSLNIHSETHVLATTGPHTNELPLTDLAAGSQGSVIRRGASDWEELAKGTHDVDESTQYALVTQASDVGWEKIIDDDAYSQAAWENETNIAPSKNATYDKLDSIDNNISGLAGALVYKGTWDASSASYPPTPTTGDYWYVSVAGTTSNMYFNVGDLIVWNGSIWQRVHKTEANIYISVSTNDSIQEAVDMLNTAGGGTIFIEPGNHTTATDTFPIAINMSGDNIEIYGAGVLSVVVIGTSAIAFNITNASQCILRSFKINATALTSSPNIITINELSDNAVILDNVTVVGNGSWGRGVYGLSDRITVKDCYISDLYDGIYISGAGATGIYIYNNIVNDHLASGIVLSSSNSTGCTIIENICNGNGGYGISADGDNVLITGNMCDSNTKAGIQTDALEYSIITNNQCNNSVGSGAIQTGIGIFLNEDTYNCVFSNNVCLNNDNAGIYPVAGILADNATNNNTFTNNICINSNNTGAEYGYGIYLGTSANNYLSGNKVSGNDIDMGVGTGNSGIYSGGFVMGATPANDGDYHGTVLDIDTTGCSTYNFVYSDAFNSVLPSNAGDISTMPVVGMCVGVGLVLTHGTVRNESWTLSNLKYYASTTNGGMVDETTGYPSATDDIVQIVGKAVGEDEFFVNPSPSWVKHV